MNRKIHHTLGLLFLLSCFFLTACAPPPPNHPDNVCSIFRQYPTWYWAAQSVEKKYFVPISVQMAIIHQESHFVADAKPPREHILWIIPWFRPTSASGYAQAIDSTWKLYKKQTGSHWVDRNDFSDAIHFMGWYLHRLHFLTGAPLNNAYNMYLAYHEGAGGYNRRTYRRKPWLMAVAEKVNWRAHVYHAQLVRCASSLPQKPWWRFW